MSGTGSFPAASQLSFADIRMRPPILFTALLRLQGFLARIRWALGADGRVAPTAGLH